MLDLTDEQVEQTINNIAEDLDRREQEAILCGGWVDAK